MRANAQVWVLLAAFWPGGGQRLVQRKSEGSCESLAEASPKSVTVEWVPRQEQHSDGMAEVELAGLKEEHVAR